MVSGDSVHQQDADQDSQDEQKLAQSEYPGSALNRWHGVYGTDPWW